MADKAQLISWFSSLKKPTGAQFAAMINFFREADVAITINDLDADLKAALQNAAGVSNDFKISFYNAVNELPANGSNKVLYVVLSTSALYVWNVNAYKQVGGSDPKIKTAFTTNITVGGVASGTNIAAGTDIESLLKQVLTTIYYPALVAPSFGMFHNAGGLRKIGETTSFTLGLAFNRGVIGYSAFGGNDEPRAGAATGYTFLQGNNNPYPNQPQGGNSFTIENYTVVQGANWFKGKVAYAAGPQPVDSTGANYNAPLSAGESAVQQTSFEGVHPLYATTETVAAMDEQGLISMLAGNNIELNLAAEGGGQKQRFGIPTVWLQARPLQAVRYYNPVSGQFDTTNVLADFATSNTSRGSVAYTDFTNTTANRGATKIQLIF